MPCLLLDRRLKIIRANDGFCGMFGCDPRQAGTYFTQFFASFFDAARSAELFRAVLSREAGFTWTGWVRKPGSDQLLRTSAVMIEPQPALDADAVPRPVGGEEPPRAYRAVCLDMSTMDRTCCRTPS